MLEISEMHQIVNLARLRASNLRRKFVEDTKVLQGPNPIIPTNGPWDYYDAIANVFQDMIEVQKA